MDLLIKGMEMPSKGCKTIDIHADGTVYVHGAYPTELHKAIPVPTPHGRLIDADELNHEYYKSPSYLNLCKAINDAPTVMEAEEG